MKRASKKTFKIAKSLGKIARTPVRYLNWRQKLLLAESGIRPRTNRQQPNIQIVGEGTNPQIRNCTFKYECPLDWNKLQETADPAIRFCGVCSQNVYFVRDRFQFSIAVQNNRCVCVPYEIFDQQDFNKPKHPPKRIRDPAGSDRRWNVLMGIIVSSKKD